MSETLRGKGKSTVVWVLMGMLVLGLGGFGITNFGGAQTPLAQVGKTEISTSDYLRALQFRLRSLSEQVGQPVTLAQAETFGIPQAVQGEVLAEATLTEVARLNGVSVGDARVAAEIASIPAFQRGGRFDRAAYADLLARQGLTEAEFETRIREGKAREIMSRAIADKTPAPTAIVDAAAQWLGQTRDIRFRELTEAELAEPVQVPDEATLKAWHQASAERFTAPEKRKISYVWLTPDMLADQVALDEKALRDLYQERIGDFQKPEHRLVERLVFPDMDSARAARAAFDAGQKSFEDLAKERGLSLADTDLGEQSQADLGPAGAEVFALTENGQVVGPVETALGPALFRMNGVIEAQNIPFEQAREELASEAMDARASRLIEEKLPELEDRLAGGATLEDLAKDSDLQFGQMDWVPGQAVEQGSIAGYDAFREKASLVTEKDFPTLVHLDDGGVFALRLDQIVPPTLTPFDEAREAVTEDWMREETHRRLVSLAEDQKLALMGDDAGSAADLREEKGVERNGFVDGTPTGFVERAFAIKTEGETEVVDLNGRVFILTLDHIHPADMQSAEAKEQREAIAKRLSATIEDDIFAYYIMAYQKKLGASLDQNAVAAANARVQ